MPATSQASDCTPTQVPSSVEPALSVLHKAPAAVLTHSCGATCPSPEARRDVRRNSSGTTRSERHCAAAPAAGSSARATLVVLLSFLCCCLVSCSSAARGVPALSAIYRPSSVCLFVF